MTYWQGLLVISILWLTLSEVSKDKLQQIGASLWGIGFGVWGGWELAQALWA